MDDLMTRLLDTLGSTRCLLRPRRLPAVLHFVTARHAELARQRLGYQSPEFWDWLYDSPPDVKFESVEACLAFCSSCDAYLPQRLCTIRSVQLLCLKSETQPRKPTVRLRHISRANLDWALARLFKFYAQEWTKYASNETTLTHTSCMRVAAFTALRASGKLLPAELTELDLVLDAVLGAQSTPVTVAFPARAKAPEDECRAVYAAELTQLWHKEYMPLEAAKDNELHCVVHARDDAHRLVARHRPVCAVCVAGVSADCDIFCM